MPFNALNNQNNLLELEFKDKNWLYISWEITDDSIKKFLRYLKPQELKDFSWALRIIPENNKLGTANDIYIFTKADERFMYTYINHPPNTKIHDMIYFGEFGLLSTDYIFFPLLRSKPVSMPKHLYANLGVRVSAFQAIFNNSSCHTSAEVYYSPCYRG